MFRRHQRDIEQVGAGIDRHLVLWQRIGLHGCGRDRDIEILFEIIVETSLEPFIERTTHIADDQRALRTSTRAGDHHGCGQAEGGGRLHEVAPRKFGRHWVSSRYAFFLRGLCYSGATLTDRKAARKKCLPMRWLGIVEAQCEAESGDQAARFDFNSIGSILHDPRQPTNALPTLLAASSGAGSLPRSPQAFSAGS